MLGFEVAEFRDRDAWLRYRDGLIVVKMDNPRGDHSVFAVYNGYDYLEEETNAVQRLVDSGLTLNQSQGGMCICRKSGTGLGVSQEGFGP